jgi:hypothetical protein
MHNYMHYYVYKNTHIYICTCDYLIIGNLENRNGCYSKFVAHPITKDKRLVRPPPDGTFPGMWIPVSTSSVVLTFVLGTGCGRVYTYILR